VSPANAASFFFRVIADATTSKRRATFQFARMIHGEIFSRNDFFLVAKKNFLVAASAKANAARRREIVVLTTGRRGGGGIFFPGAGRRSPGPLSCTGDAPHDAPGRNPL
jgi:hypothetical protein